MKWWAAVTVVAIPSQKALLMCPYVSSGKFPLLAEREGIEKKKKDRREKVAKTRNLKLQKRQAQKEEKRKRENLKQKLRLKERKKRKPKTEENSEGKTRRRGKGGKRLHRIQELDSGLLYFLRTVYKFLRIVFSIFTHRIFGEIQMPLFLQKG